MVMLGCACWNAVTTLSLKTFVSSGLYPCQKVTVTFCVVADWVHAAPRSTSPSSSVHTRPILRPITPPSKTNSRIGNPVDCLLTCSPLDHLLTKPLARQPLRKSLRLFANSEAEQLAQNERRRADRPAVVAPALHDDVQVCAEIRERLLADDLFHDVKEGRSEARAFTAHDHALWIQDRDQVGHRQTEVATGLRQNFHNRLITLGRQADEGVGRYLAAEGGRHAAPKGGLAYGRLETASTAAVTEWSVRVDDGVTELAGTTESSAVYLAVQNYAQADATPDGDSEKVAQTDAGAIPLLGY